LSLPGEKEISQKRGTEMALELSQEEINRTLMNRERGVGLSHF
jgi:hypothetical protein